MSSGPKKLSNGTLSLRFMQNAQRAQKKATEDLVQAEIHDSEQWSIPQNIQDSWPKSTQPSSTTTESSYLPFIFEAMAESSTKVSGRRVFKKGREEAKTEPIAEEVPPAEENRDEPTPVRPIAISGSKMPTKKIKQPSTERPPPSKPPSQRASKPGSSAPTETGFLRPSGVDAPKTSSSDVLTNTRERKKKRTHDGPPTTLSPKKKKQKDS
ncbi:hypothetical protein CYLTODRAFT_425120 [Cylindrobasidium torrendii FP15055 ss-10]|uniref:Uncharacterized protein n=1 Tax=Cylindrobasidium torrendii FP15055 ss-10 TaxID=1314674 RepID=A0A0D7B2U6_9AGAR|nr:hypothetical protein CYLTODRAFT_425120 [Cylindrobasidium torrendii FP15055 ss-10]